MTATIPQKQFITIIIKIEIFESSSYRCCVFKLVELGDYQKLIYSLSETSIEMKSISSC